MKFYRWKMARLVMVAAVAMAACGVSAADSGEVTHVETSADGIVVSIVGPRDIVWSDYLGVNTDLSDLTNPVATTDCPAPALDSNLLAAELDALQSLGLTWIREPVRWQLELTQNQSARAPVTVACLLANGTAPLPSLDSNLDAVYSALIDRAVPFNVDFYLSGVPCWAEAGPGWPIADPKHPLNTNYRCNYLTGQQNTAVGYVTDYPDNIAPMGDVADYQQLFAHLAQQLPMASLFETWDEENSSAFWAHKTSLHPSDYTAVQMASDFAQLTAAAMSAQNAVPVSAGGLAYYGDMNGMTSIGPPLNTGYSSYNTGDGGFPVDVRNCTATADGACYPADPTAYPDALNPTRPYNYHLQNGLAPLWYDGTATMPPVVQFHPYADFEPGNKGSAETWVLQNVMHTTAQLRGQEGLHNDSLTYDLGPQYFTTIQASSIWAGEFGVSAETYTAGSGSACAASTTLQACGEQYQALYDLRQIALMSALDLDRMMLFQLSDYPDPNYLQPNTTQYRDYHYGLLRADGSAKPVYTALQRLLAITGPELRPGPAVGAAGGVTITPSTTDTSTRVFCVSWLKPDGSHLLMLWSPDTTETLSIAGLPAGAQAHLYTVLGGSDTLLTADASGTLASVPLDGDDDLSASNSTTVPAGDLQILTY